MANIFEEYRNTEEKIDCVMGPSWKQTYNILVELFDILIPESIIREIISFHAASPPELYPTYYPKFQYTFDNMSIWPHIIYFPKCCNCNLDITIGSLTYIVAKPCIINSLCDIIKIRLICIKCMPESLLEFVDSKNSKTPLQLCYPLKLEKEAKFGPGLIPQNNKARAALLCIDENWILSKSTILFTLYDNRSAGMLIINMQEIFDSFDLYQLYQNPDDSAI